jgi:hypothetical protein
MSLIAEIEVDLKDAMRARDGVRTDTLRLTLAALRAAEKELGRPLKEDEELQVLQRERKRRAEAAEAFRSAGRDEQADKEHEELEIIEEFMPEPLDEEVDGVEGPGRVRKDSPEGRRIEQPEAVVRDL